MPSVSVRGVAPLPPTAANQVSIEERAPADQRRTTANLPSGKQRPPLEVRSRSSRGEALTVWRVQPNKAAAIHSRAHSVRPPRIRLRSSSPEAAVRHRRIRCRADAPNQLRSSIDTAPYRGVAQGPSLLRLRLVTGSFYVLRCSSLAPQGQGQGHTAPPKGGRRECAVNSERSGELRKGGVCQWHTSTADRVEDETALPD